jgi:hypothetical protein
MLELKNDFHFYCTSLSDYLLQFAQQIRVIKSVLLTHFKYSVLLSGNGMLLGQP